MDIAKYIGQYLLKNSYCYIHGLGNLELVKKPAVHDGKSLLAPSHEVVLTAGGSIDDSFANFIATNEQISISKAANALRDFSIAARAALEAGHDVPVEGLGRFISERGKIRFVTHPEFIYTPAGVPTVKNSKQLEEQKAAAQHTPAYPAPPPSRSGSVNWTSIVIIGILLVLLAGGGVGYYYYMNVVQKKHTEAEVVADTTAVTTQPAVVDSFPDPLDTSQQVSPQPAIDSNAINTYRLVIGSYPDLAKAQQRIRKLVISGYTKSEIVTEDSVSFFVLLPFPAKTADTGRMIDSIGKFFGYPAARVYNK